MMKEQEMCPIYVDAKGLAAALSVSATTASKIGRKAGAFVKLEDCTRFNLKKVLAYIEGQEGTGNENN